MVLGYKYDTLEEAEASLQIVNTYFEIPCGETLTWTNVQVGDGFWYLSAYRLEEVLGVPVIIIP
jgi:hypothetical protein